MQEVIIEATKEEVQSIVKRFYESRTKLSMTKLDKNNIGAVLLLRYLAKANRPVSAVEISRFMNVSTARVAVLLRTMSEKGLIIKTVDGSDARKVCVSISEKGKEHINEANTQFMELMTEIITKVGVERMETFLEISQEINAVITKKLEEKKE